MSKERELLKRVISGDDAGDFFIDNSLYKDIDTFLAQPEQTEQEPVAWMYEWEEIGGKKWSSVRNGKYPPIIEEEYCMRNLRPLYTSLPKREPLSDEDICEILLKKEWKGFVELIRQVERFHGIGE